jgi:dihydrofolate reductase
MIISIIAAVTENNVIGANGNLPFKQKDDLLRFKFLTQNNVVIMGRKTFESIGSKPLPNRTNIVISHNAQTRALLRLQGVVTFDRLTAAIKYVKKTYTCNCYIIGGGQVYKQALAFVDRLHITKIHAILQGDVTFPKIDTKIWQAAVSTFKHKADADNEHDFSFTEYIKHTDLADYYKNKPTIA